MKRFRKLKIAIIVFLALFVVALGYSAYVYFTNEPPEDEIKLAIEALAAAKQIQANKYAKVKFTEAQTLYDQAMTEWRIQNERFFLSRDYVRAKAFANRSAQIGKEAYDEASIEKNTVSSRLNIKLDTVYKQLTYFEKYYKNLPLSKTDFTLFGKSRIRYDEAKNHAEKGQIYEAEKLVTEAETMISAASKNATSVLNNFYASYDEWIKDARYARQLSSSGQTVILVNKIESTCAILRDGKTIATFPAEFGPNWMGTKKRSGDKATPEGVYRVTQKKSGSKTTYYKSLLLNYPNDEDKARFSRLVKSGAIPKSSKIGGMIEIHGGGGKGVHWTSGCVALSNSDMDRVYNLSSVNTPVVIIGSEKPKSDYLNN
jgi:hypothetical protein